MNSSLASYYSNELDAWNDVIQYHVQEIEDFEAWLGEIIQGNTIPDLAAQTEQYFTALDGQLTQFENLAGQVVELQDQLVKDGQPVGDDQITPSIESSQNALRGQMLEAEKQFLNVKYDCQKFLSDTLGRQSHGPQG